MRSLRIKNTHLCIHLFTSSTTPAVSDTKKALNKCFRIQWIKINSCHVSIKTSYNLYSHFCFYLNFFQFISYSYPSVSPVFSNSYYFGLLIFFSICVLFPPNFWGFFQSWWMRESWQVIEGSCHVWLLYPYFFSLL